MYLASKYVAPTHGLALVLSMTGKVLVCSLFGGPGGQTENQHFNKQTNRTCGSHPEEATGSLLQGSQDNAALPPLPPEL